jgi:DNA polymerase-3 subunit delta'
LHILVPEGASGYLAEQMQELIRDASLAPMEAARKVYIITQAERMTVTFANAFLKTLEEPPASVVFVLISRSLDAVLPTIRSRCQAVLFGSLPESHAIQLLVSELAVDVQRATLALSISAGSIQEAKAFLLSESRHAARRELMIVLRNLQQLDSLDILAAVRDLLMANKIPLDELRIAQERELATARDSLSKSALASLEQSQKREITAAERAGLRFNLQMIRSWLRDLLAILTGQPTTIVNYDEAEAIQLLAKSTDLASLLRCLEATNEAWENLDYNVSVQLIFEYLLFTLRDELGERS